jgi:hypothetical protein
MLGTMMLPTVIRKTRQHTDDNVTFEQMEDQNDGTCSNGGMASPTNSTNSEDSIGPIPAPLNFHDPGRKNPFPMPARLHDPLDFDLDSGNNLIAARPTVPRLYSSYSSQRKDGIKGMLYVFSRPRVCQKWRASRLLCIPHEMCMKISTNVYCNNHGEAKVNSRCGLR